MAERVAVVTGAAGGIGRAVVAAFRRDGWIVAAIDRAESVDSLDTDCAIRADISVPDEAEAAVREAGTLGTVSALVNNAAIQILSPIVDTSPGEWDAVMASNVRSAYLAIRLAYPLMREQGGAVVNVGSVHAVATSAGIAAYATSKGALVAMTRAAALELAPDGIRVNAILPGAVDTPMLREGVARFAADSVDARLAALAARTPLGRIGRPDEIAEAVLFFASPDRSSFITGQTLIADGGATARLATE